MLEADDAWLAVCSQLISVTDIHLMRWEDGRVSAQVRAQGRLQSVGWTVDEIMNLWHALMWHSGFAQRDLLKPQHGMIRFLYRFGALRLAYAPMALGQRLVVRIHGMTVAEVGIVASDLEVVPGLVVFYGRTGAGKTTQAYAHLERLSQKHAVVGVEDPPECLWGLWAQFDRSLTDDEGIHKLVLRHNPDVLFWGEVRDASAWGMLENWITSGHLVLTTLHADTEAQCVDRLQVFGADLAFLSRYIRLLKACVIS